MSLIFIALLPYENISTTKFSQITVRHLRLCELTSGYVTSFLVAWLPFPLRYRFVAAQMHPKPGYSGFPKPSWGTSSLMTSLRVMWGYFRSRDVIPVKWLVFPASYCLECVEMHQKSVYLYCPKPCDVTPCLIRSLLGGLRSLPVIWRHFWSCDQPFPWVTPGRR